MDTSNDQSCEVCYRIICKQCKWEADDNAVVLIQCGQLTACPECGWRPGEPVL